MRPITLHVSALNEAEYELYTTSLLDLAADDGEGNTRSGDYDQLVVGVREVRAWLKGRFSHIQPLKIDEILRFFSPNLSVGDTLSGGQFFAALRLAVHIESGKDVDRNLAFAQAFPRSTPPPPQAPASPPKRTLPIPPNTAPMVPSSSNPFTHPAIVPLTNPFNPFTSRSQSQPAHPHRVDSSPQKIPPLPPRKPSSVHQPPPRHASQQPGHPPPPPPEHRNHASTPSLSKTLHVTSPLMKQSLQASKVGQTMKKVEEQLEKERILQVLKSSNSATSRGRSTSPNKPPPPPPPRPASSSGSASDATTPLHIPPLPRRQLRAVSPPASTTSLEQVALARPGGHTEAFHHDHSNSPFKTPDQPFKEASYFTRSPSISPERVNKDLPPPKHPKRKPPPPIDSALSSTSSVSALSSADSTVSFRDRDRAKNVDSPLPPVPTNDSPTSRVFRSKSVHYPSPPPVPPPLHKRRPESVQVAAGGNIFNQLSQHHHSLSPFGLQGPRSDSTASHGSSNGAGLSRHVSMSASTPSPKGLYHRRALDHDTTPLANFQRTLATFQPKLDAFQPKLEKVRYKAEAGLSRRGFVRDGLRKGEGEDEEGLMYDHVLRRPNGVLVNDDDGWEKAGGMTMDSRPGVDSGEDMSTGETGIWGRGRRLNDMRDPGGPLVSDEQDNLKLLPGDGWKPL